MKIDKENIIKVSLPTDYGKFVLYAYNKDNLTHLVLIKGNVSECEAPLVRIHSECMTGDVFGSKRCDCGLQLKGAMELIEREQCGIIIYLRQEGRGIGLFEKVKAYKLQEEGMDTLEANLALGFKGDERTYDVAADLLEYFGVKKIRLITNNPEKIEGLEKDGIEVVERVASIYKMNEYNQKYMATKKIKMGHLL